MSMTRQEILTTVYNKLRFTGAVKTRREFSDRLDYNYTCLSAAMNGEERYLTDRFFKKIAREFPQVNPDFLENGRGEPLRSVDETTGEVFSASEIRAPGDGPFQDDTEALLAALNEQAALTKRAQEQTEKALGQIDELIGIIKKLSFNK